MKMFQGFTFISLFLFSSCATVSAKQCQSNFKKGRCTIKIDDLRPTQYSLGMLSIDSKVSEIEKAYLKGKFNKYLKSKIAPAIIGPDNNYYITDRHHTSFAITKAAIPEEYKVLKIKVLHNWSNLSFEEFEKKMIENKYVWLKDENHTERDFKGLPKSISDLTDDPYRSLAWKVRKAGGFQKVKVSYLEFYWGIFFKESGIRLSNSSPDEVATVLEVAINLAYSKKASHLPGFKD
jgi:hypothetical protein